MKPFKTSEDEDFHDLIAERYKICPTIITSNLGFSEWGEAFNYKLLGAVPLDRLRHGALRWSSKVRASEAQRKRL
nr:ATP-binding protein [Fundidesulfovibrio soli]